MLSKVTIDHKDGRTYVYVDGHKVKGIADMNIIFEPDSLARIDMHMVTNRFEMKADHALGFVYKDMEDSNEGD